MQSEATKGEGVGMRAGLVGGILCLVLAGGAQAQAPTQTQTQTWDATTWLQAGASASSCPKASATYGFTLNGAELVTKIPAGKTHRGTVAADGQVSLQYDSGHPRIGIITIGGNARTRQLTLQSSAFPTCLYALTESAPNDPPTAYAGSLGDWALGRWDGLQVRNVGGVGLQSSPYALMVERLGSGKVFCRFNTPEVVPFTLWAQRCRITADTIDVASGPAELALQRVADRRLEGTMRYPEGSAILRLGR